MNYFSKNIRFLRNKGGLRQSEMLEKIGIARTTWSSYENGISQPNIDGILRIAYFFGITSGELLETDLNVAQREKETEALAGKPDMENLSPEGLSVTGRMLFEVVTAKQRVIDTQAQTIRSLQAIVGHLTKGDRETGGKSTQLKNRQDVDSDVRVPTPASRLHP